MPTPWPRRGTKRGIFVPGILNAHTSPRLAKLAGEAREWKQAWENADAATRASMELVPIAAAYGGQGFSKGPGAAAENVAAGSRIFRTIIGKTVRKDLTPGPGGKMLQEAISTVRRAPPTERAELMESYIQKIEQTATEEPWKATRLPAVQGASAWCGKTHSVVIDAQGNIFKGSNDGIAVGRVDGRPGVSAWSGLKSVP